jgi:hypothetical protein
MLEEKRRLALVRLQAMMAGMARREAMRGLADAVDEERRRTVLAERSAGLLAAAGARGGASHGADVAQRLRFGGVLARVAGDAAAARGDAQRQAAWQADLLAAAEARARRIGELESAATTAFNAARERAEQRVASAMARKLHGRQQTRTQRHPAQPQQDSLRPAPPALLTAKDHES